MHFDHIFLYYSWKSSDFEGLYTDYKVDLRESMSNKKKVKLGKQNIDALRFKLFIYIDVYLNFISNGNEKRRTN